MEVEFASGEYGKRAVLKTSWSRAMLVALEEAEIIELELNTAKGWHGDDLSFLKHFPKLVSFEIIDHTIDVLEPIHCLNELKRLKVNTYCKSEIRFDEFPQLESCVLEWRPKAKSLFGRVSLKDLFINRYAGFETDRFSDLTELRTLGIVNSPIRSIDGVRQLTRLESLRLGLLRKLQSLDGVQGLACLLELDINTCRGIDSIEEVRSLPQLKRLYVNNCGSIASLKPIEAIRGLEAMLFYESTDIADGDLSPLLRQSSLKQMAFKARSHYSHRRSDFTLV